MNAIELIENNSLTNIEVTGGQTVVFTEIAMTAINIAREEGANDLIEQASANGQKKHQQGIDFMKSKAIEAFQKTCYFRSKGCICMTETGQCNCPSFFEFIKELE